jgi:hypothetical protein
MEEDAYRWIECLKRIRVHLTMAGTLTCAVADGNIRGFPRSLKSRVRFTTGKAAHNVSRRGKGAAQVPMAAGDVSKAYTDTGLFAGQIRMSLDKG